MDKIPSDSNDGLKTSVQMINLLSTDQGLLPTLPVTATIEPAAELPDIIIDAKAIPWDNCQVDFRINRLTIRTESGIYLELSLTSLITKVAPQV
jgi:hypothetical protein